MNNMNLRFAVVALRWHQQRDAADFARDIGITTKEYLRFERGETISTEVLLAIVRWLFVDDTPKPAQLPLAEATPE